jgi:hypothetical protein
MQLAAPMNPAMFCRAPRGSTSDRAASKALLLGLSLEIGHHEIGLRAEVPVEGDLRDARRLDDAVGAGAPDAVGVDEFGRGIQDAGARDPFVTSADRLGRLRRRVAHRLLLPGVRDLRRGACSL